MDFPLPFDEATLSLWLLKYGGFALFGLLALGIIILPIPDETLMVLSGVFMSKGLLPFHSTIFAAYTGAMTGITISYLIGRYAGVYVLHRYRRWFRLTKEKEEKMHLWFQKYGKWSLVIGYFIPGIRHLSGIIAGITRLDYPIFALFAYSGAFLWASFFLSIGYYFGEYWTVLFDFAERRIEEIILILIAVFLIFFAYRFFKKKFK